MLVLSRQRDETVVIGDDIEIKIVDIRGDKVRLGITAPPHISVHRKEVYEAIQKENQSAACVNPQDLAEVTQVPRTSGPAGNDKRGGKGSGSSR
jgi:carbon storage regulator